jgi:predicted component of type VI protein secretion system
VPYQLVIVKGRSANQVLSIPSDGVTTVGRQQGCQIRIASSQVSRKHCELFEKKGHLLVKDLGSSNGTLINGKKIDGQQVVENGSILTIGSVVFRVESAPAQGQEPPGGRPNDTAVAQPVAVGEGDDYEIEADSEAVVAAAPAGGGLAVATEVSETEAGPSMGEDDVADFLLEIDLDEDDKR